MTKFLHKMRLPLLLVAILVAAFFVFSEPAEADVCPGTCGVIRHYSPDAGHDADITVRCDYGVVSSKRYVPEGHSSSEYCGRDTDQVYVHTNEELWCRYPVGVGWQWAKTFDATGWHKMNDTFNRDCVVQRD